MFGRINFALGLSTPSKPECKKGVNDTMKSLIGRFGRDHSTGFTATCTSRPDVVSRTEQRLCLSLFLLQS